MPRAEWLVDQPAFLSYEQITPGSGDPNAGGLLAVDYTDNIDTRWRGQACLGPKVTNIDLSGLGGTTANVNCGAIAPSSMNATGPFLYMGRGTDPAKVKLSDMSSVDSGISAAEAITSMIYSKSAAGTEEIAYGMDNTPYGVITTVGNTTDTTSTNDQSYKIRIFGYAGADPNSDTGQIAGFGRGSGTPQNKAFQNVLSGSVTMDASNWQQRAVFAGESLVFTGFVLDGRAWLVGTDKGPYYLNADFKRFVPLIEELARSTNHCRGMFRWSVYNGFAFIPLQRSLRTSKNVAYGASVGVETYRENRSPVQGQHTGGAASERWAYLPVYNPITDQAYLCAARPRQDGDWHQQQLSYYPIVKLASGEECNYVTYTGTEGGRTLPTVVFGRDSNAAYFGEGRVDYFPSDTSYEYASTGSLYLTELRRSPNKLKVPRRFRFYAEDLGTSETIAIKVKLDGGSEQTIETVSNTYRGGADGWVDVRLGETEARSYAGFRIQPVLTFASGTATASPRIVSNFEMEYDLVEVEG